MKVKSCGATACVMPILLGVFGVLLIAGERQDTVLRADAGLELLVNGGFEGPVTDRGPTGWFKAIAPTGGDTIRVELQQVPQRGNVAFMELKGLRINAANNWAQRVSTVPVGATVRVTADVKTQDAPPDAGFVMVQCWDASERLISGASSQSVEPIGGTEDWRRVSFEFVVPSGTEAMILRCGLAGAGRIWFDNVSMKAISATAAGNLQGFKGRGFEVTGESLEQLKRVNAFSHGLAAYAQQELGTSVRVRREVFAQGNGQFQIVLLLDLSKSE